MITRNREGNMDGVLRRTRTADACGDVEEINIAPAADYSMNQILSVVLPQLSECHRLIWGQLNHIRPLVDDDDELNKAFDIFPYLRQKQTVELAERCSLQPEQVKVWFMVQRLRYGVSWDYKDIIEVRRKFNGRWRNPQGTEGLPSKEAEQSANVGRIKTENVNATVQLEGKMMLPPMNIEDGTLEQNKRKPQTKRRTVVAVTNELRNKKMKQDNDGSTERATQVEMKTDCGKSLSPKKKKMMLAFSHCPYPNSVEYDWLARSIDIPRHMVVKWFCDTRYNIKRRKLYWMDGKHQKEMVADIQYQQYLNKRASVRGKTWPGEGSGEA